jgi:hypothetical protein
MSHSTPFGNSSRPGLMVPMAHPAPVGATGNRMRFGMPGRVLPARMPYNGFERAGRSGPGWGDRDRDRNRWPYRRGYGIGLGYGYGGWPGYPFLWNDPGFWDNDAADYGDYDAGNGGQYAAYGNPPAEGGYGDNADQYPYPSGPAPYNYGGGGGYPPADESPQGARMSYAGPPYQVNSPLPEQAVTVIFNDGRPSEQIHNYLLTSTTLTILDHKYREIPLDQINLAATQATNLADGVDFRVPPSR